MTDALRELDRLREAMGELAEAMGQPAMLVAASWREDTAVNLDEGAARWASTVVEALVASGAERVTLVICGEGGRAAFAAVSVEGSARPLSGPQPATLGTTTGPDGSFVVEGLLPRDYVLELSDPVSLQRVSRRAIGAGSTDVALEFPSPAPAVRGIVRTPDGAPFGGALLRTLAAGPGFRQGPQVRADPDGAFRFDSLAEGTLVQARVGLPWVHLGTRSDASGELDLGLEPAARLRLRIRSGDGFGVGDRVPDGVVLRDTAGEAVPVVLDDLRGYRQDRIPIPAATNGRAEPLPVLVPVRARELVFMAGDTPVLVRPLDLAPGQDVLIEE